MSLPIRSVVVTTVILGIVGLLHFVMQEPFTFLSWESKTIFGSEVYNRIQFVPGWTFDTWLMQQSHHGPSLATNRWDRLAIVVDKSKRPYQASFYQFVPGELKMGNVDERAPYGAPCFSCHANGPRAIRPNDSDLIQKIQTSLLNIRIKTYMQVDSIAGQPHGDKKPFRRQHPAFRETLDLPSCRACHGDEKIRRALRFEHLTTAQFLVDHKQMPPWPFSISREDQEKLFQWATH